MMSLTVTSLELEQLRLQDADDSPITTSEEPSEFKSEQSDQFLGSLVHKSKQKAANDQKKAGKKNVFVILSASSLTSQSGDEEESKRRKSQTNYPPDDKLFLTKPKKVPLSESYARPLAVNTDQFTDTKAKKIVAEVYEL